MCKICPKLTITTPECATRAVWVSFMITLNKFTPFSSVYIADYEQVNAAWIKGEP